MSASKHEDPFLLFPSEPSLLPPAVQFHQFPRLPPELREWIWEHAVTDAYNTPTAYHADLLHEEWVLDRLNGTVLEMRRDWETDEEVFEFLEHEPGPGPLSSLLQTSQHARAVALRAVRPQPSEPVSLYPKPKPGRIGSPDGPAPGGPAIQIDGAKDLVIVQQRWLDSKKHLWEAEQPQPVQYIALPLQDIRRERLELKAGLSDLRELLPDIRALYVLVDPETVRAAQGPWPKEWENPRLFFEFWEQYLGGEPQHTFCAGKRRYFDIAARDLQRCGGLRPLVEMLRSARLDEVGRGTRPRLNPDHESIEPARLPATFRLMTWRDV